MSISKVVIVLLIVVDIILLIWLATHGNTIALLQPKGMIAQRERSLILSSIFLMMVIVIPVVIATFSIAFRYREGNAKGKYNPDQDYNIFVKISRWAVPAVFVLILSVMAWNSTHALDPFKPIQSAAKPLTIEVVALNWKWLFIYPEQHIATVNYVQFPVNTPVQFELTADNAPMNSFWIPQLGGQMYAMAGMTTQLHLIANELGEYGGNAVEINGKGFAGMRFTAKASSQEDFNTWVESVQQSPNALSLDAYNSLAKPSEDNPRAFYYPVSNNLYNEIMRKYMGTSTVISTPMMQGM